MNFLSDVMFWREAMTVFAFALFLGITAWAWSPLYKREFEKVAQELIDDQDSIAVTPHQGGRNE